MSLALNDERQRGRRSNDLRFTIYDSRPLSDVLCQRRLPFFGIGGRAGPLFEGFVSGTGRGEEARRLLNRQASALVYLTSVSPL